MGRESRAVGSRIAALAAIGGLAGWAAIAHAEPAAVEPVRLVWTRTERAAACADGPSIARQVEARVGRPVFSDSASTAIEGAVDRLGEVWEAELAVRRGDRLVGSRRFASRDADCAALVDAVTLGIALVVGAEPMPSASNDPPLLPPPAPPALSTAPAPPDVPPARPAPPEETVESNSDRAPPRRPARESVRLTGRALVAFGLLPVPAAGIGLATERPLGRWLSVGIGFLYLPDVSTTGGSFSFGLAAGTADLCVQPYDGPRFALSSCARLSAGSLRADAHGPLALGPAFHGWAGASLSTAVRVRLVGPVLAELGGELLAPIMRNQFLVSEGNALVFQEDTFTGLVFGGLVLTIP